MAYMTANFEHLRVRVNVTWTGTLLELTETSALVRVPTAPPTDRQTTVVINAEDGEAVYLPGRVVLSIPQTWGPGRAKQEHHIVVEFFGLSAENLAMLRHIIARASVDIRHHQAA
jgi:hypothetical protein